MDAFLVAHAANAYGVDPALVTRAMSIAEPFPLPADFLASAKWIRDDADKPEHNAYLTARWIASLTAQGLSPNAVLDEMTTKTSTPWKAPLHYRIWKWLRRTPR